MSPGGGPCVQLSVLMGFVSLAHELRIPPHVVII